MTWDERFTEIEEALDLHADSEHQTARDREIDELAVERAATVGWVDRCFGRDVTIRATAVGALRGELAMATRDWVLLHHDAVTDWVVAQSAVMTVRAGTGPPRAARSEVQARMAWRQAWAALVRDRDEVVAVLLDGSSVRGVPTRAGKDYVEIGADLVPYVAVAAIKCPR